MAAGFRNREKWDSTSISFSLCFKHAMRPGKAGDAGMGSGHANGLISHGIVLILPPEMEL